jgi:hypothetical protein
VTEDRDLVRQYLHRLRGGLRGPDAGRILVEAEDHLREGTAAGVAAGLTEREAQEAAISAFGSVLSVIRAHQTRRARAALALSGLAAASAKATGLFLVAFSVSSLVLLARAGANASGALIAGAILQHVAAGVAGLAVLAGCRAVRRFWRGPDHVALAGSGRRFPVAAVTLFGGAAATLVLLRVSGAVPVGLPPILACLALGVGYTVRMRLLRRDPAPA